LDVKSRRRARRAGEAAERDAGSPASDRAGVRGRVSSKEGWEGWNEYAPFYDWENAQTVGRRDIRFWQRVAQQAGGPVLELGCGTGRIALPLARAGVDLVGLDRSAQMLERLQARQRRRIAASRRPKLVRGDIRSLPFADSSFAAVIAPYGILQSLLSDRALAAALAAASRVLTRGGLFGIDLVPDVPRWREYSNRVQLRGSLARGVHLTLIESVRQDRARRLTTFEQRYVERRRPRPREHRFELTFRTLSVREMIARIERAGFVVDRVLGDYRGRPWDERSDVWIILAKKR
jgi:ubiquinone/menaquinone biosynthesis C-methylase UbiE